MRPQRVLVVDDEEDVREGVSELLRSRGFIIEGAANGREAMRALFRTRPDLVVLDIVMPVTDGWQTLEQIRAVSDVPVIMLTGRATEVETIRALQIGADDFVTKPFRWGELVARVEGVLRRTVTAIEPIDHYVDSAVDIDFREHRVQVNGVEVDLTPLEFRLLAALVRHPRQLLTHDQLRSLVWGDDAPASGELRLYVGYLRRKLADASGASPLIVTVRGIGYRYLPPESG